MLHLSKIAKTRIRNLPKRLHVSIICGLVLIPACSHKSQPSNLILSSPMPASSLPSLGPGREIEEGVIMHEVMLPSRRTTSKLRIYLPKNATGKMGCVFVAPAGTPLFYGCSLGKYGEGDEEEQIPYAEAGLAVVAYSIDGDVPNRESDGQIIAGAHGFMAANAGIDNTREAITYALARIPNIDPKRIYTAGHSSAAVLSIQAAQHDDRIAACLAYAPATDIEARLGSNLGNLDHAVPGISKMLTTVSPINNAEKLKCPLFLFHADDDSNVPTSDNERFADSVKKNNSQVTFVRVPSGGHYESMIEQGIPKGIAWLKSLPK